MPKDTTALRLVDAACGLAENCRALKFSPPVTHVYHPLSYAWKPHETYLRRYGGGRKRVVFLGMNPGPWGMAQTGVPFGEIRAVVEWLDIQESVTQPDDPHPARPVSGFRCARSEVSGRRLWGLMKEKWGSPEAFFRDHFVANYCPLLFLEAGGRNRTPDKLNRGDRSALYRICDRHLRETVAALEPEWVIGVGRFAEERARKVLAGSAPGDDPPGRLSRSCDLPEAAAGIRVAGILHPSPANPQANRGWAAVVSARLESLGVW
jgi:single-strand selective monofunctional uracil DNA glycosylase